MILWLLSGETLLSCQPGREELGTRRWLLLLDSDGTVGGVGNGVICAVVNLCLAGSVLATLGVRMGRRRRDRGTVCIYWRGWDLSWRIPL